MKEKDSGSSEVNFDLNIDDDDDLFANVDMDDAMRKAEKKYSPEKEKSTNISKENTLHCPINDPNVEKESLKLNSPSLLTVTQAIEIINEPTLPENADSSPLYPLKKTGLHTLSKYSSDIYHDHQSKGFKNLLKSQNLTLTLPRSKIVKNLSSEFSKKNNHLPKVVDKSFKNAHDSSSVEKRINGSGLRQSEINKIKPKDNETLVQFQIGLSEFDLENNMPNILNTSLNRKDKPNTLQRLDDSDDLFMDIEDLPDVKTLVPTVEGKVNLNIRTKSSQKEASVSFDPESNFCSEHKAKRDSTSFCEEMNNGNNPNFVCLSKKRGRVICDMSAPNFIFKEKVTGEKLKQNSSRNDISFLEEIDNCRTTIIPFGGFEENFAEENKQKSIANSTVNDDSRKDSKMCAEVVSINTDECEESMMIFNRRKKSKALLIDEFESDESLPAQKPEGKRYPLKSSEASKKNRKRTSELETISDDDFVDANPAIQQTEPVKNKIKKSKVKNPNQIIPRFINNEADVDISATASGHQLSSDESESSLDAYDSSFVDDEIPSTQQRHQEERVDMQAIYLKSVRSPANKGVFKIPQVKNGPQETTEALNNTLETTFEDDDALDDEDSSFVVGNDVVEYDTCYMGDTMLAEDPIMNEVLLRANKKSHERGTTKRRRILQCISSSDEESSSPLKNSSALAKEQIFSVPFTDCKKSQADEELSKLNVKKSSLVKNKNKRNEVNGNILSSKLGKSHTSSQEMAPNFSIMLDDDFLPSGDILGVTLKEKCIESFASETKPKSTQVSKFSYGAHYMNTDDTNKTELRNKSTTNSSSDDDVFLSIQKNSSTHTSNVNTSGIANITRISASSKVSSKESKVACAEDIKTAVVTPFSFSPSSSQTRANNLNSLTSQCILVDTTEVSIAGNITSSLRLEHGAQTHILQVAPASYIISSRMALFRQNISVFANSSNRSRLTARFRELLSKYQRLVVILEKDSRTGLAIVPRTYYVDSISCACAQLPQLKVFYSCDQNETVEMIRLLSSREKLKGFAIPLLPSNNADFDQVVKFYRSVPSVSAVSALFLALNFSSVDVALKSDVKTLMEKGRLTSQSATYFKSYFQRTFRKDLLKSSLKQTDL
ncbi:Fanconi anemia group M protein [Armadillidium nasatum]|uniref:Fanconi anemia group M protein n=1 Tax=Armadillidium nasatum TaxID=96803 RepID=A0A5N5TDH6_9CRUS|nr:Fanconi anemia group M protein [Armadillidium nasatum]